MKKFIKEFIILMGLLLVFMLVFGKVATNLLGFLFFYIMSRIILIEFFGNHNDFEVINKYIKKLDYICCIVFIKSHLFVRAICGFLAFVFFIYTLRYFEQLDFKLGLLFLLYFLISIIVWRGSGIYYIIVDFLTKNFDFEIDEEFLIRLCMENKSKLHENNRKKIYNIIKLRCNKCNFIGRSSCYFKDKSLMFAEFYCLNCKDVLTEKNGISLKQCPKCNKINYLEVNSKCPMCENGTMKEYNEDIYY